MNWPQIIALIVGAYLLGSIATSVWVGRLFYGIDIRKHGSGNAGATNTIRILGYRAGIPVLLIDMAKGYGAVSLIYLSQLYERGSDPFVNLQIALGTASVLGHVFPAFVGFRGGKGVATLFGVLLAINPLAILICALVFFANLFITRIVSLSSILSGIAFPIVILTLFPASTLSLKIFSGIIGIALVLTHHKNLRRLMRGEEKRADFLWGKKNKDQ